MPKRHFRQHYQHMTEFNRSHIVGLYEGRWSYRAVALHVAYRCQSGLRGEEPSCQCCVETHQRPSCHHGVGEPWGMTSDSDLGILKAQHSVSDMLHPHVLPLLWQHPDAIFQQDNTHPHTAHVSTDCLHHGPPMASQVQRFFSNRTCVRSTWVPTRTQCQSSWSWGPVTTAVGRLASGKDTTAVHLQLARLD